jgi:hypothetical protein
MNPHRGHVGRITPCSLFGRIRVPQSAQKRAFGRAGMTVFELRFRRGAPEAPDRDIVLVTRESAESGQFLSVESGSQDPAPHEAAGGTWGGYESARSRSRAILRDPLPGRAQTAGKGEDGVVMDRRNLAFPRRLVEETV